MRARRNGPVHAARQLIIRHGLAAAAVAQQHATEAQLSGDVCRLHHWREVRVAIGELRRTVRQRAEALALSA